MTDMSAADILALKPTQARTLFPGDDAAISARFKQLAKIWHPDRNPAAGSEVFARIVDLHLRAKNLGALPARPERLLKTADGRVFRFEHLVAHATDFGEILVGRTHIAHIVPADLCDLAEKAAAFRPRFADDGMRAEMERFLPRRKLELMLKDGSMAFIEAKDPDQVLLRDLMALAPFDAKHVAWMATRLVNICCWLEWAGLAHGAIGPDTLLVSPKEHSVALTGPFLAARSFGREFRALPQRTIDDCPTYAAPGASADARLDLSLVRLTMRECLGDASGVSLRADPDFPKPFADWLTMPPPKGARADFPAWEIARDSSFGTRRFVKWDIDPVALMAA